MSLGPSPGLGCNQGGRFRADINAFKGLCWVGLLCDGLVLGGRSRWMGGCWVGLLSGRIVVGWEWMGGCWVGLFGRWVDVLTTQICFFS